MTERGEQIRAVLDAQQAEAHLSGLDVLSPWSTQNLVAFPHLVVSSARSADEVAVQLSAQLGVACARESGDTSGLDDLVVIYQTDDYDAASSDLFLHVASHPRAWVESYQALNAGIYPVSAAVLGEMLLVAGEQGEPLEAERLLGSAPTRLQAEIEALLAHEPLTEAGRAIVAAWEAPYRLED